MSQDSRPNDPTLIDYEPARPAILRSAGLTPSERYLAGLAERTFLNLWSYPNTFIDKRSAGKGHGKELCDLLVVCGDHVLIFSDKAISWPSCEDVNLAWSRWYKRAILKSVSQIRGAERWIADFPERVFLDRSCTERLPLPLPPAERRKVHGIVVALGAGNACKEYFGDKVGSLLIAPDIRGDAHWNGSRLLPFAVGDIEPGGPFIHVLDDATLDFVMGELDTITDVTSYLIKKEQLIRSGRLIAARGEEELVAYYMTHMNKKEEHDFTKPDGSDIDDGEKIVIDGDFYAELIGNEQYHAKKAADKASYVWDRLIEAFTTHMLAGTTIVPDGGIFNLAEHEEAIRYMALVPRYLRRSLGRGILDALQKGRTTDRFSRAFLPGPTERGRDTGFFFMTLAVPKIELKEGYEQYRAVRRSMLETYALGMLQKNPKLRQVVGIATEPPSDRPSAGSSEDLIMARQPEWTPKLLSDLEDRKKAFHIFQSGNYAEYSIKDSEYPEVQGGFSGTHPSKLTRAQRRAKAAEARRQQRKRKNPR